VSKVRGVEIRLYGVVQGVGMRWFVERNARIFNLKGFVKNLPDGSVLVRVKGEEDKLREFINILRTGNRYAVVEDVDLMWDVDVEDEDFHIAF